MGFPVGEVEKENTGFTIPTNPCGTTQGSFGFGEAEDYTIVVSGADALSAP